MVEGPSAARTLPRDDQGRWQILRRECGFFFDLASGEVLDRWRNPLTDEDVEVVHIANDPVDTPLLRNLFECGALAARLSPEAWEDLERLAEQLGRRGILAEVMSLAAEGQGPGVLAFKALVQAAGGRDEKFELVHGALPGVITLQVYRKLTWLQGDLHSLGFTWADKQSISRLSREQVLEMLERSRRYVPALFDNEEWSKMVDQEVYDIRRLPADAALRIRRPVKTHPMINLLWQDREPRKQQIKASLPLLLCSDTQPAVTHLGHYQPKLRQARRDRKIGGDPIIERLHLYLYQG